MKIKIRANEVDISADDLRRSSNKLDIRPDRKTRYYVLLNSKTLPAKTLLLEILREKGLNFTPQDITTSDAIRIFRKLGLSVIDIKKRSILDFAGVLSIGGDALEDERKLYTA